MRARVLQLAMMFSETVIRELAKVWTKLHGSGARFHLEYTIGEAELSGDADGIANWRRVLALVIAYEERRLFARGSIRIGSPYALGADPLKRSDGCGR
jgi:hypothetical protein